jgi:hypothetical protein
MQEPNRDPKVISKFCNINVCYRNVKRCQCRSPMLLVSWKGLRWALII